MSSAVGGGVGVGVGVGLRVGDGDGLWVVGGDGDGDGDGDADGVGLWPCIVSTNVPGWVVGVPFAPMTVHPESATSTASSSAVFGRGIIGGHTPSRASGAEAPFLRAH